MFDEIFIKPFNALVGNKPKTVTIVVAKAYCTPARHPITAICNAYGVKLLRFKEHVEMLDYLGINLPHRTIAEVTVSAKQGVWMEYLLLRSKKFFLVSHPLNERNREWASKHHVMPEAWNGKPLIESGCDAGEKAFEQASKKNKGNS